MKYTPRQRNYRKFGHRERYTRVEITDIQTKG
jgi:ribosomal protein L21